MELQRKTSDAVDSLTTPLRFCYVLGQLGGCQVRFCLVPQVEFPLPLGVYLVAVREYISKFPFIQKDASGLFHGVNQGTVICLDDRENIFENMHLSKKCQCKLTKGNLALPVDAADSCSVVSVGFLLFYMTLPFFLIPVQNLFC